MSESKLFAQMENRRCRIREFVPDDAQHLSQIFFRSVRELGPTAYNEAQVTAWAPASPPAEIYIKRANKGRTILVAVDENNTPLAYGDLEPDGHIDQLFCLPETSRRGIGSALCDALEARAAILGLDSLFVEASEIALSLFRRKGFTTDEKRNFLLRGVPMHHYRMSKRLTP